jgi:hypothetical protein
MDLEETEARNDCADEDQQQINRPTDRSTDRATGSDDYNTDSFYCSDWDEVNTIEVELLQIVRVSEKNKRCCELDCTLRRSTVIPGNTG